MNAPMILALKRNSTSSAHMKYEKQATPKRSEPCVLQKRETHINTTIYHNNDNNSNIKIESRKGPNLRLFTTKHFFPHMTQGHYLLCVGLLRPSQGRDKHHKGLAKPKVQKLKVTQLRKVTKVTKVHNLVQTQKSDPSLCCLEAPLYVVKGHYKEVKTRC